MTSSHNKETLDIAHKTGEDQRERGLNLLKTEVRLAREKKENAKDMQLFCALTCRAEGRRSYWRGVVEGVLITCFLGGVMVLLGA